MFTIKYKPDNLQDFIGNKKIIQPFIKWLLEWKICSKTKCLLISGINGIGKSLLVELILIIHNYNIINISADEEINKELIKPMIQTIKTYDDKNNVLVFNDIDTIHEFKFISNLAEIIKESHIPIICICDNRYDQNIKPILKFCFDIKLIKPTYDEIYYLVYKVVMFEKIKIKKKEIDTMIEQSNGDIRFILNTLQLYLIPIKKLKIQQNIKNIQSSNIFETAGQLFSMDNSCENKYITYWTASDIHGLFVQENYINNTLTTKEPLKKIENISYSADALSDADLFDNYVEMTNWDLQPYVAMSTIKATLKCNKKSMIKFPQFLGKTSIINKNKKAKLDYNNVKFIL